MTFYWQIPSLVEQGRYYGLGFAIQWTSYGQVPVPVGSGTGFLALLGVG